MHFLVVGANGRTGSLIVDDALSRGHTVTALVRNPAKIVGKKGLTISKGTPTNYQDMRAAFDAHPVDTVVVALSSPRASDSPFAKSIAPPRLMADSVANATRAMKEKGVQRIIIMQAFGVGSSWKQNNFLIRFMFTVTPMAQTMEDHNLVDKELRASSDGLSFTMVRPAMLKGDDLLPVKVFGDDGQGAAWMPQVSRPSVARFIVEDCAENEGYLGQTPVIAN